MRSRTYPLTDSAARLLNRSWQQYKITNDNDYDNDYDNDNDNDR